MDSVHTHGLLRRVAVGLVAALTAMVGSGLALATVPAGAATAHRAAVVVEVDGVIHTAKVTFSADSISGLDALRSAGFDPAVRVFGGNGGAVCALRVGTATIGCPADGTCLKCSQPAYWGYFRALAGTTSYTYSIIGAGNTQVHDGDVEAWAWGTGSPPSPFVSFTDVWGTASTTTTTDSPVTHPSTTRPPVSTPPTVGGLGATSTTAVRGAATSTTVTLANSKASTTTRVPRGPTTTEPTTTGVRAVGSNTKARRLAGAPIVATGGGGSPYGIVAFAVILAVLVGAIVFARRRRSAAPAR